MANETIVIVDDNATNQKLVRIVLEEAGYAVHAAGDAASAFALLERVSPQLILMDIQLPDVNGIELTRQLKADPRHAHIVIVALSAYARPADRERALAAGCAAYITKPIDIDGLLATVAAALTA